MGLWWDPFIQSRNCMSLKFTGKFCVNDNEEWCKIWRGIELSVQNWHEEFDKLDENPKNLHFNRLHLTKVCNAWAKKGIEELCLMALKLMQNLKETGLCFLKFSFNGWKIVISFYKVKWQNSLKAELTDSLWKLPGCFLFSRVGIGWWTLL